MLPLPMVTVALDGTQLLGPRTGIGTAVLGLFEGLAARPEVSVKGYALSARGWRGLPAALPAGVQPVFRPLPAEALLRLWSVTDLVPVEVWAGRVDVVHGTNYVVPPARRAARIVSVWDMTPVRYPELCTATSLRYPHLVRRAVARGAWVHTGSGFVAAEITEHFGVAPERVKVVAPPVWQAGSPEHARQAGDPPARPVRDDGPPYILFIGASEPRKDLPTLVAAFDALAARHPDIELRLVGPPGWAEDAVAEAIERAAHRERIRRLGWVPDISGVIAGAALLAYPSLYEGFGLPPLEAMSAGVPVVATTAGSVPEVTAGAALLVAPRDPDALAAAMQVVLDDPEARSRMIAAGRARAAQFTVERAAGELARVYLEMSSA